MSWRKNRMELMATKTTVRHSCHVTEIEQLEADMAVYLAKGGKIKPAVCTPRMTLTERQKRVKI